MNNKIVSTKTISLFLAFMSIAGTITIVSVYGQQSNAPFVTENELQAALADVVTQEDLQAALADVVTQEDLQAALADIINSQNTYPVTGTPASFGNGIRIPITSTALCNQGAIILEGGYSIFTQPGADIDLSSIITGPTIDVEGYFITAAGNNIGIQSNALCFDTP